MNRKIRLAALSALLVLAACSEQHDHSMHGNEAGHAHEASQPIGHSDASVQLQDGISVQNAWVRPTVGAQDATGAYLTIDSKQAVALVGVASPVAEIAELHEMKMDGDIMRMRAVQRIDIKPSEPLELKPGGFHVMLMALTSPVLAGQEIELSLQFEKPDGGKIEMPVKAVVGQN